LRKKPLRPLARHLRYSPVPSHFTQVMVTPTLYRHAGPNVNQLRSALNLSVERQCSEEVPALTIVPVFMIKCAES
jgi:hypothetical protein